ncbi:MAG: hypothetical protein H6765_09665 [Candidatus Peribacteria bacterium]|nr:MAG: hypothetical protein H6765_09665 [Candidatus Peribacteria bacterium]
MIIRENKLTSLARQPEITEKDIADLTNDERNALSQYLNLRSITDDAQLSQQVRNVVTQGIG